MSLPETDPSRIFRAKRLVAQRLYHTEGPCVSSPTPPSRIIRVSVSIACRASKEKVIVVVPEAAPVTSPLVLTVAMPSSLDVQVPASPTAQSSVWSLYAAQAVSWTVWPTVSLPVSKFSGVSIRTLWSVRAVGRVVVGVGATGEESSLQAAVIRPAADTKAASARPVTCFMRFDASVPRCGGRGVELIPAGLRRPRGSAPGAATSATLRPDSCPYRDRAGRGSAGPSRQRIQ